VLRNGNAREHQRCFFVLRVAVVSIREGLEGEGGVECFVELRKSASSFLLETVLVVSGRWSTASVVVVFVLNVLGGI
jgi:hypothetical protein